MEHSLVNLSLIKRCFGRQLWILLGRKKYDKIERPIETLLVVNMSAAVAAWILTLIRNVINID